MRSPKLLCVDDDAAIRRFYGRLLSSYGYQVKVAGSARQALKLFRSDRDIDAVIADYDMPEMNGAELAADLKQLNPGLPVIMVSGCQSVLEEAPNYVDASLPKGASVEAMVNKIEALLNSRHATMRLSRYIRLGSALASVAVAWFLLPKIWKW